MKNITVSISDDVYRAARVWAAQRGTSLSNVVRYLLSTLHRLPRAGVAFPLPGEPAPSPLPPAAPTAPVSAPVVAPQETCAPVSQ